MEEKYSFFCFSSLRADRPWIQSNLIGIIRKPLMKFVGLPV